LVSTLDGSKNNQKTSGPLYGMIRYDIKSFGRTRGVFQFAGKKTKPLFIES